MKKYFVLNKKGEMVYQTFDREKAEQKAEQGRKRGWTRTVEESPVEYGRFGAEESPWAARTEATSLTEHFTRQMC